MLMHFLHHTCVKFLERYKGLSPCCLYLSPRPSSIFCFSALWFFSFLFSKRADCAALCECSKRACLRCIVPPVLNMFRKAWKNNVRGRSRSLCSLFHLFCLLPMTVMLSADLLQVWASWTHLRQIAHSSLHAHSHKGCSICRRNEI